MSKRSATSSQIGGLHEKSASSTKSTQEAKSEEKSSYRKNLRPRPAKPVDYREGLRTNHKVTSKNLTEESSNKGDSLEASAPKRHCPDRRRSHEVGEKVKGNSSNQKAKKVSSSKGGWAPFIQPPAQSSDSEEDNIEESTEEPINKRESTRSRNLASRFPKKQTSTVGGGGRRSSSDTTASGHQQGDTTPIESNPPRASASEQTSLPKGRTKKVQQQLPPPQEQPEDLSVRSKGKKRSNSAVSAPPADHQLENPIELRHKESHTAKTGSCASTRCRKGRGKRAQQQQPQSASNNNSSRQQDHELQQQSTQTSRRQQLSSFHQDLSLPAPTSNPASLRSASASGTSTSAASLGKYQDRKALPTVAANNTASAGSNPLGTDVESFLIPQHYGGRVLESLSSSLAYENQLTAAAAGASEVAVPPFLLRQPSSAARDGSMSTTGGGNTDSDDHEESDMSRLQALLEARNMPIPASTILNNLGPRIQQMLHRPATSGASSKAGQLIDVMKSSDESRQLQAVIEMCQILVMGNEDTLTGFPIRAVVPLLINLLKVEHNFDMMNHACRAISYMMEALPRSSGVIVQAVPVLLQKLQSIQCMDVAEQSLSALEQLSRQHSAAILSEDGFNACLLFIEFFSLPAQRNALKVAANCCCCSPVASSNMTMNQEFQKYFATSIPMLVQKLSHHDKKCLESICLCFARLVDQYHSDVSTLKQLGDYQLLENFQNLLVVTPPLIGSHTFVMVIKTMYQICSPCPELANRLVRNNIADTLQCLLCGSTLNLDSQPVVILPRSPQELFEITALIRELMPKLPTSETVFSVDSLLASTPITSRSLTSGKNIWQWQDDSGEWKNYTKADSRKIEIIRMSHRPDVSLMINGRPYTIDFSIMQQINDDSGVSRTVRKIADTSANTSSGERSKTPDLTRSRSDFDSKDKEIIAQLVRSLSKLLYEVFSNSAGSPPVRQNCVFALKKMIYYAESELLDEVLKDINISSNITSMLSSTSLDMIVAALQMSVLLMEKLFDQFQSLFQRQGVVYQVAKLLEPGNKVVGETSDNMQPTTTNLPTPTTTNYSFSQPIGIIDSTTPFTTASMLQDFKDLTSGSSPSFSLDPLEHFSYHTRSEPPKEKKHGLRISKKKPHQRSSSQTQDVGKSSSRTSNRNKGASTSASAPSVPVAAATPSSERIVSPPLSKAKSTAASSMSYPFPAKSSSSNSHKSTNHKTPTSSFLTNIQPPWSKMLQSPHIFPPGPFNSRKSYSQHLKRLPIGFPGATSASGGPAASSMQKINTSSRQQEIDRKIKTWIREQASSFLQKYFPNAYPSTSSNDASKSSTVPGHNEETGAANNNDDNLLGQLTSVASLIDGCKDIAQCTGSIKRLRDVVTSSDASPFELQHSGVIGSLLRFLTASTRSDLSSNSKRSMTTRRRRVHEPTPVTFTAASATTTPHDTTVTDHQYAFDNSVMASESTPMTSSSGTDVLFTDMQPQQMLVDPVASDEQMINYSPIPLDTSASSIHAAPSTSSSSSSIESIEQDDRLRCFLHVFADLPMEHFSAQPVDFKSLIMTNEKEGGENVDGSKSGKMLQALVSKLNMCVNQVEQLPVKLHDVSAVGNRSEALSYFTRNQLKCHLQRHPDSPKLKQWPGGAVRVDPLAMVSAIEKYLVNRGYSVPSTGSEDELRRGHALSLDDDDSEDEIDETYEQGHNPISSSSATSQASSAKRSSSSGSTNAQSHRLELSINGRPLQTNMTVYQAIKTYSRDGMFNSSSAASSCDNHRSYPAFSSDTNNSTFWNMTHVIHYKHVPVDAKCTSSRGKTGRSTSSKSKRHNFSWSTGRMLWRPSHLNNYVKRKFQIGESALANDPAKEVLSLLKVIYGLSKHWHMLYSPTTVKTTSALLPPSEFVISKLSAKCTRQVQDPLMIMTGEIPSWVGELARVFPFVLPFETRQLVFRIVAFDRDRAMHYLIDSGKMNEINSSNSSGAASSSSSYGHHDSSSRFTSSKVDKKKYVVKRDNLLNTAEKLMQEHAHQKHIIEVQYDGEVGTGLGPTQEFYTLAGNELQRCDLNLWRNDQYGKQTESSESMQESKKIDEEISDDIRPSEGDDTTTTTTTPTDVVEYVHSNVGLFPRPTAKSTRTNPNKTVTKFRFLGRLLAKALMDNRLVDLPLSPVFYKWLLCQETAISWHDLIQVDHQMSLTFFKLTNVLHQREIFVNENRRRLDEDGGENTVSISVRERKLMKKSRDKAGIDVDQYDEDKQKQMSSLTVDGCSIEDLSLDFQLPGFPEIEMVKNGSNTNLTLDNLDKYLNLIAYWTLHEGVRHQMEAVKSGFTSVLPLSSLEYFYPEELDQLFCGARFHPWTEQELADACRTDHGYTLESETVKYLFQALAKYDAEQQRKFLQFVTGSPHLPIGGLRAMNPPLTLVRKTCEEGRDPDEYLPSVMTCVNYLKIPEYSCKIILEQRFNKAVHEGQQSFLLS